MRCWDHLILRIRFCLFSPFNFVNKKQQVELFVANESVLSHKSMNNDLFWISIFSGSMGTNVQPMKRRCVIIFQLLFFFIFFVAQFFKIWIHVSVFLGIQFLVAKARTENIMPNKAQEKRDKRRYLAKNKPFSQVADNCCDLINIILTFQCCCSTTRCFSSRLPIVASPMICWETIARNLGR